MCMGQISEFLSEPEAMFDMFWRNEVFGYFNTTVQIMNLRENRELLAMCEAYEDSKSESAICPCLMRSSCWNENYVSQKLYDSPALNSILLMKTFPQRSVQVPTLVMNRIMIYRILLTLFFRDLKRTVTRPKDVMHCIKYPFVILWTHP